MSTTKEFLSYFMKLYRDNTDITVKPMMGEYLLYFRGKLVGDICDNRIFIKPVSSAKALLPEAEMQPPYKGAKDMLVIDDFENTEFMLKLFEAMYLQLPEPKKKIRKN